MREARIDLATIRANVEALLVAGVLDGADVAAGAYGHGAVEVARAATDGGAGSLVVRSPAEQLALRDAGIRVPVSISLEVGSDASAALYGLGPVAAEHGCVPAMRVSAGVMSLKTIDAGEGVSYGYTWRAPRRTNLALVPLGYADGLTRAASNLGRVLLGGALRPIVGRVAMDVIVLDLGTDIVYLGAEAVLFGPGSAGEQTADQWATALGLAALDATTGIGARVPRSFS